MNPEMWEELKEEIRNSDLSMADADKIFGFMAEIEHRHLPERVAEILEKADYIKVDKWHNAQFETCIVSSWLDTLIPAIAKALRTGDTTEIEKWVRSNGA